jgi:hypothetical protein
LEASTWRGEITNLESEKCDEIVWFSENNLPENIAPEVKLALEKIKDGEFYSENGFTENKE